MTHIVNYPTKKAFKEAVETLNGMVYCNDPSIFAGSCSGTVKYILEQKAYFTVTNHPKRSWFAEVSLKNGKVIVK